MEHRRHPFCRLPLLLLIPLLTGVIASMVGITTDADAGERHLKPFTSDGCSLFPDGTHTQQALWHDCCTAHDVAYWMGGSQRQRQQADQALSACVAQVGAPNIARLMLAGVRVGGSPYLPTRFRWGYGWPFLRGYAPLTDTEIVRIKAYLHAAGVTLTVAP